MRTILVNYSSTILKVLLAFFAPISGIILLVGLSVIIDTLFGIWKAYKKGDKITSRTARFGFVPKTVSYCGAVCLVYATDYWMINDLTLMVVSANFICTKLLAIVLISIEVKSMDESFEAVKGYSFLNKIIGLVRKAKDIKKELQE